MTNQECFFFGSNMLNIPKAYIYREISKLECFNLLFVGIDWNRKGGSIALKCLLSLYNKGYNVKLTVCGCIPPIEHPAVKVYPFLDKNNPKDLRKLEQLYFESHLFILPTRAECAGIVFAEAASYSLPIISTNTGGVPSYVKNNYNGYLLDLNFEFQEYESVLVKVMTDYELYNTLSSNSYKLYSEYINWNKFGDSIESLVDEIM